LGRQPGDALADDLAGADVDQFLPVVVVAIEGVADQRLDLWRALFRSP
jgi:hypothetical protein